MEQFGYLGIVVMIALENVFPPIPSEVILTFGGFMTTSTDLTVPGVIAAATAGSVAGAVILYGIGHLLQVERLELIVNRWGHILRITKEDIHKANRWFEKYGYWTVLFCRMIPLIRSLISIPAGMSKMRFWLFVLFTTIGTLIWNIILVLIGASLGESWQDILGFMDLYSNLTYAGIGFGLIVLIILYVRKRRKAGRYVGEIK
jgi:membrane protein DedA with SNARE-associated domain